MWDNESIKSRMSRKDSYKKRLQKGEMHEVMKVLKQVHGTAETRKGGGKKRNPQVSLFSFQLREPGRASKNVSFFKTKCKTSDPLYLGLKKYIFAYKV